MKVDKEILDRTKVFIDLCDNEAPKIWEELNLGLEGIGVYDVGEWLRIFATMWPTDNGWELQWDEKKMLRDFGSMQGITLQDILDMDV